MTWLGHLRGLPGSASSSVKSEYLVILARLSPLRSSDPLLRRVMKPWEFPSEKLLLGERTVLTHKDVEGDPEPFPALTPDIWTQETKKET